MAGISALQVAAQVLTALLDSRIVIHFTVHPPEMQVPFPSLHTLLQNMQAEGVAGWNAKLDLVVKIRVKSLHEGALH